MNNFVESRLVLNCYQSSWWSSSLLINKGTKVNWRVKFWQMIAISLRKLNWVYALDWTKARVTKMFKKDQEWESHKSYKHKTWQVIKLFIALRVARSQDLMNQKFIDQQFQRPNGQNKQRKNKNFEDQEEPSTISLATLISYLTISRHINFPIE